MHHITICEQSYVSKSICGDETTLTRSPQLGDAWFLWAISHLRERERNLCDGVLPGSYIANAIQTNDSSQADGKLRVQDVDVKK